MKILLFGNPNVGKSAVFTRLTGIQVTAANYPGTTVEYLQGSMVLDSQNVELIDVPGIYGLEPASKAEEIALDMLKSSDLVINVLDATNLERNLHLTLHLLEQNKPMVVALNIFDDARHKGIDIDIKKLEELLGVPVIPTVGVTGEGIKELVLRLKEAKIRNVPIRREEERFKETGRIAGLVQNLHHRHHTLLEVLSDISVAPLTGIPIAVFMMFLAFKIIRFVGEGFIGFVFDPLFENLWLPIMTKLSDFLSPGSFLHNILIGQLIDGKIDFVQSFGAITTGLYVALAMVLPYVFSFYLILSLLEDFGYLPRLAVLLDAIMHKLGLHGWAIIPILLGFGCNVPGIIATRILENRRQRFIAVTLISVGVPCAALQAMIWGMVGKYGGFYVAIIYLSLFFTWVVLGFVLNKIMRGRSPELIMEMPPYRMPVFQAVIKKLWMRMSGFLKEAMPLVIIGVAFVNLLYFLNIFDILARFAAPVITNLFGLPKEAVMAILIGFLRKDVAIGMLGPLNLTAKQMVVAATVLSMFFPCVATFVVMLRELGRKDTIKSIGIMIAVSIVVGSLLNIIL